VGLMHSNAVITTHWAPFLYKTLGLREGVGLHGNPV
jgi:hypothetical protein